MTAVKLWNTAVRVIANLPARSDREAVLKLTRALRQAGFDVIEDTGRPPEYVTTGAFEAEEGTVETILPPHRQGRMNYDWGEVS